VDVKTCIKCVYWHVQVLHCENLEARVACMVCYRSGLKPAMVVIKRARAGVGDERSSVWAPPAWCSPPRSFCFGCPRLLSYFGRDTSSHIGDAFNTTILLCGEERFPFVLFPLCVLRSLPLDCTSPVVPGAVLYTESIICFENKIF